MLDRGDQDLRVSNFVADAANVIGFNPYVDLAELIVARAGVRDAAVSAA